MKDDLANTPQAQVGAGKSGAMRHRIGLKVAQVSPPTLNKAEACLKSRTKPPVSVRITARERIV